ncbi:hypothetical protein BZA05DRAFT_422829 [Tricharina praecox]|uniref:uncharacterized protein n=1 Tax=Tricharina praecox TaxID=43433 RepID=UPI00221E655C|nr:uncharacterized protein BZA05DRAFT_422829 [Tricharina praecox]KAI5841630.1 hypothetical protein BZA05DRAFT_422829 [Tricharina praecox]
MARAKLAAILDLPEKGPQPITKKKRKKIEGAEPMVQLSVANSGYGNSVSCSASAKTAYCGIPQLWRAQDLNPHAYGGPLLGPHEKMIAVCDERNVEEMKKTKKDEMDKLKFNFTPFEFYKSATMKYTIHLVFLLFTVAALADPEARGGGGKGGGSRGGLGRSQIKNGVAHGNSSAGNVLHPGRLAVAVAVAGAAALHMRDL